MKRILLTVLISLGLLLSCATAGNHPTITKDQAYEYSQLSEMIDTVNEEIDPYTTIINEINMQEITSKMGAIVERFGYDKKEFNLAGWREGNLFYIRMTINLKHFEYDYIAIAMYVWEDTI